MPFDPTLFVILAVGSAVIGLGGVLHQFYDNMRRSGHLLGEGTDPAPRQALAEVARRLGGEVLPGKHLARIPAGKIVGFLEIPGAKRAAGGVRVYLPPLKLGGRPLSLDCVPSQPLHRLLDTLGLDPPEPSGDSRFDASFRVMAAGWEGWIKAMSPEAVGRLLRLAGDPPRDLHLRFLPTRIELFRTGLARESGPMERFFSDAVDWFLALPRPPLDPLPGKERAEGAGAAGPVLIVDSEGVDLEAAVSLGYCPTCGDPVAGELVCVRCETPHHEDCWRFAGGCATYACGSSRARRMRLPAA